MSTAKRTNVAVTGATGQLGRAIVAALKAHGVTPIGVVRSPEKGADLGIELRKASYDEPEALHAAFEGVESVVLVSGNTPPDVRLGQHQRVIDAAKAANVGHLAYVGIVVDDTGSEFNGIQHMSRATEEYLSASGLAWSVGRNGLYIEPDLEYLDNYVEAGRITNCAGDGVCAYTSRAELALAFAHLATEPALDGKIYNLTAAPVSQTELTQMINEVFGTELSYETVPVERYREQRVEALGEFIGGVIAGIYDSIRMGGFDVKSDFEAVVGRPHKSVRALIEEYRK